MITNPPIINYEGSDYQSSFWDTGGRAYEDAVEGVALRRLLPAAGKHMLELGAGAGRNTPRYRGFDRIVLLDYSRTQLELAQQRLGTGERYRFVAADIYRLPFAPGSFDAATLIRALHHLSAPSLALKQVRQVVAPGAVFILEFANKQNLKAVLRYLFRRQSWNPFSPEPVEFAPLNFDFHPSTIRAWLQASGFALERTLTVSHFRFNLFKKLLPLKLLVALDALAQLTGDAWQLSPSVFTRSRAVGSFSTEPAATPMALPMAPPSAGFYFRCPACGCLPLADSLLEIICPTCGRRYPVQDGIYDFRLAE